MKKSKTALHSSNACLTQPKEDRKDNNINYTSNNELGKTLDMIFSKKQFKSHPYKEEKNVLSFL